MGFFCFHLSSSRLMCIYVAKKCFLIFFLEKKLKSLVCNVGLIRGFYYVHNCLLRWSVAFTILSYMFVSVVFVSYLLVFALQIWVLMKIKRYRLLHLPFLQTLFPRWSPSRKTLSSRWPGAALGPKDRGSPFSPITSKWTSTTLTASSSITV